MNKSFAPILIPTLNRFEHFKRCVDSLSKNTHASETKLYIALDYPTKNSHWDGYNKIVDYLDQLSGFQEIIIIKRNENFGAVRNMFESIDELFKKHGELIFSEDDNFFSPNFLDYVNKGLRLLETRSDIFAVSGYSYPIQTPKNYKENYYLAKSFPAWGVGLWKEKYSKVDISIVSVEKFLKKPKNIWETVKTINYLLPKLFDVVEKKHLTGDVIFSMNLLKKKMFCVLPTVSKSNNYGFDGSGVHCGVDTKDLFFNKSIDNDKTFDFSTPNLTTVDNELLKIINTRYKVPNIEIIKRLILYYLRRTNFHSYYKEAKKLFLKG